MEKKPLLTRYRYERHNMRSILRHYAPHSLDRLVSMEQLDIAGAMQPLNGGGGGDLATVLKFREDFDLSYAIEEAFRHKRAEVLEAIPALARRTAFLLSDVAGHAYTDVFPAITVHRTILAGIPYEILLAGNVTSRVLEEPNQQFFNGVPSAKPTTVLYGELTLAYDRRIEGRFICAGHPYPFIFRSGSEKFDHNPQKAWKSSFPLGIASSEYPTISTRQGDASVTKPPYKVNEFVLNPGDLMMVCSDGWIDHGRSEGKRYFPQHAESVLRGVSHKSASDIVHVFLEDAKQFAAASDDMTLIVAKNNAPITQR